MQKKLTITVDENVYAGLYRVAGPGKISKFIENLVRPHVIEPELDAAYELMAQDTAREEKALEWSEGLIGEAVDEAR